MASSKRLSIYDCYDELPDDIKAKFPEVFCPNCKSKLEVKQYSGGCVQICDNIECEWIVSFYQLSYFNTSNSMLDNFVDFKLNNNIKPSKFAVFSIIKNNIKAHVFYTDKLDEVGRQLTLEYVGEIQKDVDNCFKSVQFLLDLK